MAISLDSADAWLREAVRYTAAKDFQVALRYCKQANILAPERADIWTQLGQIYMDLGDHESCYSAVEQAIQLDAQVARAFYLRAWARGAVGDFDGEIADAQMGYHLTPNSPELYYRRLARAYAGKGDYQYALTCCHLVLAFDPHDIQALVNRGGLYRLMRRYDDGIADLERAIALSPNWYVPHYALGLTQIDAKRYQDAIHSFSKALETDPESNWYPRILAFRGYAYELAGRYVEAERDQARARTLNPNVQLYGTLFPRPNP